MLTESEKTNFLRQPKCQNCGVSTVEVIKILGVTVTNGLSVSPHVQTSIMCTSSICSAFLIAHRLRDSVCTAIYQAVVAAKLIYASIALDRLYQRNRPAKKIQAFTKRRRRAGFCNTELNDFVVLCAKADNELFQKILIIVQFTFYIHFSRPV